MQRMEREREREIIKEKLERKKWVNTNIQRDRMQPCSLSRMLLSGKVEGNTALQARCPVPTRNTMVGFKMPRDNNEVMQKEDQKQLSFECLKS